MIKKAFLVINTLLLSLSVYAQNEQPEGLSEGTKAPLFEGVDQNGETISLQNKLEEGPVVLMFYRGAWCPYCNRQLSELQDSLQLITAQGASVIAVSPEQPESIGKTIEKSGATFSILHDKDLQIMDAYGVSFTLDEKTSRKYKGYGIDLEKANGENGENLPVPATYIIEREGTIKYVFFDPDYKKRASVRELAEELKMMQ